MGSVGTSATEGKEKQNAVTQQAQNKSQTQIVVLGTPEEHEFHIHTKKELVTIKYVDYSLVELDNKGAITPLKGAKNHQLELIETVKGDVKNVEYCHGNCKSSGERSRDKWIFTDANKGFSDTRHFTMDGKPVKVYDPSSKKAYDWENLNVSGGRGVVTYGNGKDPD